ncbi:MAG TPA: phenylalanine--tRNA ligase subunit beta [Candidatus Acidoferrales bacterium]|nr:phenylalanine--tRNA ligase subunit beta [Candidatus Acidoferrales bacterium]
MKFTFNWLKEFVTLKVAPEKLAERFTMAGLEVESLVPLRNGADGGDDWLFEISVTPNRGDCLSLAGLAREVSALAGGRLKGLSISEHGRDPSIAKRVTVATEDPRLCPRYSARIVDDLLIAPAPEWMRFRLEACGIRSINNIVDVTNYVMLETGQPLHAFDLDRLPARKIIVRAAKPTERLTTLDGTERELLAGDLLICDANTPVALAGVMGGEDTEVWASTRSVLLESANFDPITIRRTAKRLGLHSEASHRFERGVDPEGTVAALNRAAYLLEHFAGGHAERGLADCYPRRKKTPAVVLREARIEKLLGVRMDGRQAERILQALGVKTRRSAKRKSIEAVPPTTRPDLTREADLIEELARVHGYQKIPSTLPLLRSTGGKKDARLEWERRVRSFLAGEGLVEVINLPFTTEKRNRAFHGLWQDSPVTVFNPLASESAEMRLSLIPGLIENLELNLAQKAPSFWAFHLGKVFRSAQDNESVERQYLAGILHGRRLQLGLHGPNQPALDFLDGKGLVEGILDLLRLSDRISWSAEAPPILHPGRGATVQCDGRPLGDLGQMHPDICDELGLPPVFLFELDFDKLLEYAPRQITAHSLPRFPSVERDFAVVVDRDFSSQQIVSWIKNLGEALIEHVQVFDQYLGSSIPEGKKSLAYKVSYRAGDRTLTDSEINTLHQNLVEQVGKVFGAELRS